MKGFLSLLSIDSHVDIFAGCLVETVHKYLSNSLLK